MVNNLLILISLVLNSNSCDNIINEADWGLEICLSKSWRVESLRDELMVLYTAEDDVININKIYNHQKTDKEVLLAKVFGRDFCKDQKVVKQEVQNNICYEIIDLGKSFRVNGVIEGRDYTYLFYTVNRTEEKTVQVVEEFVNRLTFISAESEKLNLENRQIKRLRSVIEKCVVNYKYAQPYLFGKTESKENRLKHSSLIKRKNEIVINCFKELNSITELDVILVEYADAIIFDDGTGIQNWLIILNDRVACQNIQLNLAINFNAKRKLEFLEVNSINHITCQ